MVLIGILGTIIGFYFGSAEDGSSELELKVVNAAASEGKLQIVALVEGGEGPYEYRVWANGMEEPHELSSEDGWLSKELSVSSTTNDLRLTLWVSDARSQSGTSVTQSVPTD